MSIASSQRSTRGSASSPRKRPLAIYLCVTSLTLIVFGLIAVSLWALVASDGSRQGYTSQHAGLTPEVAPADKAGLGPNRLDQQVLDRLRKAFPSIVTQGPDESVLLPAAGLSS